MNTYKIVRVLITVAMVSPVLLQGMEPDADIVARVKLSGFLAHDERGKSEATLVSWYGHEQVSANAKAQCSALNASCILAGCNTDALFAPDITGQYIVEICTNLRYKTHSPNANQMDRDRAAAFLKLCITSKKVTMADLRAIYTQEFLDQALRETGNTASVSTSSSSSSSSEEVSTIPKIGIYKIAMPVFAIGALVVIAYAWYRKKKKANKTDIETDEAVTTQGAQEDAVSAEETYTK